MNCVHFNWDSSFQVLIAFITCRSEISTGMSSSETQTSLLQLHYNCDSQLRWAGTENEFYQFIDKGQNNLKINNNITNKTGVRHSPSEYTGKATKFGEVR